MSFGRAQRPIFGLSFRIRTVGDQRIWNRISHVPLIHDRNYYLTFAAIGNGEIHSCVFRIFAHRAADLLKIHTFVFVQLGIDHVHEHYALASAGPQPLVLPIRGRLVHFFLGAGALCRILQPRQHFFRTPFWHPARKAGNQVV